VIHSDYALRHSNIPMGSQTAGRYTVHFAQNAIEVDAALKLRFDVFNLELGEGLNESFETQRDEDLFDARCHHLIVQKKDIGEVVGTYRMQTREMANAGSGFYSDGEYDLSALPDSVLANAIEVGRACIASEHRNSRVLFLLWRGLAMYMTHMQKRYLFGCCSLTSQDPDEGNLVAAYLQQEALMHPSFRVMPRPEFVCDGSLPNGRVRTKLPKLFQIYLDHRAKVCSPPAIDRQFKTIDFLVMLDLEDLDPRVRRLYFG